MKKKFFKAAGFVVLLLIVIIGGAILYITAFLPSIPVQDVKIESTAQRLERGKYLFHSVANCSVCHSERDMRYYGMPPKPGTVGMGGEVFDQKDGLPGIFIARNITPYHLASWTDGEIFRAITAGVSKDGHPLFPLMPYLHMGQADKEDIYSLIAYLRTLQPITKDIPPAKPDFPINIIIHTMPKEPAFHPVPDKANTQAYGAYLVNMASCMTCHTQEEKGNTIPGLEFAGGRRFVLPGGQTVHSTNITPDAETGIGNWTKAAFIQRFSAYRDSVYKPEPLAPGAFNTIMPWLQYGNMKEEDLSAIYDYLHSVKPIKNKVVKFPSNPKG